VVSVTLLPPCLSTRRARRGRPVAHVAGGVPRDLPLGSLWRESRSSCPRVGTASRLTRASIPTRVAGSGFAVTTYLPLRASTAHHWCGCKGAGSWGSGAIGEAAEAGSSASGQGWASARWHWPLSQGISRCRAHLHTIHRAVRTWPGAWPAIKANAGRRGRRRIGGGNVTRRVSRVSSRRLDRARRTFATLHLRVGRLGQRAPRARDDVAVHQRLRGPGLGGQLPPGRGTSPGTPAPARLRRPSCDGCSRTPT
jgi:hypothetical protein